MNEKKASFFFKKETCFDWLLTTITSMFRDEEPINDLADRMCDHLNEYIRLIGRSDLL